MTTLEKSGQISRGASIAKTARSAVSAPILWATIALFVLSFILVPSSLSRSSIDSLLPFAAILATAAVGQTIVIMLRGIDLSVVGTMTVAALVSTQFAQSSGSVPAALVLVAVLAVVIGLVNGIVVSVFSVTPLVATLALNAILLGAALAYSGGTPTRAPQSVSDFALAKTLGISNTVWVAVILVIVVAILIAVTVPGRRIVSVGSNEVAARAAGIGVLPIKLLGYVAAALCYSGAGVILAGYVSTPNINVASTYLLPTIAAVVIGGTALSGGKGRVIGTAIGALFLSQLTQLVLSLGAPPSTQLIIQAIVIAVAVGAQTVGLGALVRRIVRPRTASAES